MLKDHVFKPKFDESCEKGKDETFDEFFMKTVGQIKVLNLGCGNSILPEEMHDNDGYREIWNIDISPHCIK